MAQILVVDDELEIRELLRKALGMKGYKVATVPSARQALEIIFQEPFDLILLDIKLGQESGISVLKKIREFHTKIPVVIYSGAVTIELEKEARAAGANEVLSKNIEITQLVAQIAKIVKAKDRIFQSSEKKQERPVLIVDDDKEIRHLLRDFFKTKGYKTLEAESGESAIQLVRSEKVFSVLLDIQMPGMDGLVTLENLLKIDPTLGVVMVTAVQDDEKVKKAIELGAYGYVLKPFDFLYLELAVISKLAIAGSD